MSSYAEVQAEMGEVYKALQDIAVKLKTTEQELASIRTRFENAEAAAAVSAGGVQSVLNEDVVSISAYRDSRAEHVTACAQRDGIKEAMAKMVIVLASMQRLKKQVVDRYNNLMELLKTSGAKVLSFQK